MLQGVGDTCNHYLKHYVSTLLQGQLTIGHCGHGGQNAKVDLDNHLGIAYVTNYLSMYSFGDDPRFLDLEQELYKCLDDYIIQEGLS